MTLNDEQLEAYLENLARRTEAASKAIDEAAEAIPTGPENLDDKDAIE